MKKAIYRTNYMQRVLHQPEEETLIGFLPEYLWKSTSYFGGPDDMGEYLVIKKDGSIRKMYCTGMRTKEEKARVLFEMIAGGGYHEDSYINDEEMTDTNVMDIYRRPWGIWYETHDQYEYEDCHTDIYVYTKDSDEYSVYFLDLNLDKRIELDEDMKIKGADGEKYYKLNGDKIEYEEWEEETK